MFTQTDISLMTIPKFFNTLSISESHIEIQSKSTLHCWMLISMEKHYKPYVELLHKHNITNSYHHHKTCKSVFEAFKEVDNHDTFQITVRKS